MKLDHICMVSIRSGHYYSILTFKTLGRKCEKHCVVHTVLCSCADSHCKDMHSHIRRGINQTLCVSNRCSVYGAHHTHTHGNVISLQITSLQHCVCVCVCSAAGLYVSLMCYTSFEPHVFCSISSPYDHMTAGQFTHLPGTLSDSAPKLTPKLLTVNSKQFIQI